MIRSLTTARLAVLAYLALLAVLTIAQFAITAHLEAKAGYDPVTVSWADILLFGPVGAVFPLVGGLIAITRPRNLVGWALLLSSIEFALGSLLLIYAELALLAEPDWGLPAGGAAAAIGNSTWTVLMAGVFLLLLLFPNGEVTSRRWPFLAGVVLACFGLALIFGATGPAEPPFVGFNNPLAFTDSEVYEFLPFLVTLPALALVLAAAINLILRFRRSTGDEREQFKWLGLTAGLVVVSLPIASVSSWEGAGLIPFEIALFFLPVSVGIAVLKYRLYDIDIIINRTLVYLPLTAILAGLFVASTTLVRTVFTDLTDAGSDASIAISTLAVVALLTPLKNQLQAFVDRHFKEQQDPFAAVRKRSAQAKSVLEVLDRDRFVSAILTDLTAGLSAEAARVELQDGWSLTLGTPADSAPITAPLTSYEERIGTLSLWPGAVPRAVRPSPESLKDVAGVLAEVISISWKLEAPATRAEAPKAEAPEAARVN